MSSNSKAAKQNKCCWWVEVNEYYNTHWTMYNTLKKQKALYNFADKMLSGAVNV